MPARRRPDARISMLHAVRAIKRGLAPIATIAIEGGLSADDIVQLLKQQMVAASTKLVQTSRGRSPNRSLVSAMTGLTRPEVRRVLESRIDSRDLRTFKSSSRARRVVSRWNDEIKRRPSARTLEVRPAGVFHQIVKESSGDVPARAMLDELARLGWVKTTQDGKRVTLVGP